MSKIEVAEKLGRRWTKDKMDRIYFALDEIGVIKVSRYGTGNVSEAIWPDGEKISNTRASRLLNVKFWFDVPTGTICTKKDWGGADDVDVAKASSILETILTGVIV